MQRLVYRRIGGRESILAQHSINTSVGRRRRALVRVPAGQAKRDPVLFQQGTFAPDGLYRWMASMTNGHNGNIGVGYSYGGAERFPDSVSPDASPRTRAGKLTFGETVLVEGEAVADQYPALGGLLDPRAGPRRLHVLVRRRLFQEGRGDLFHQDRLVPFPGLPLV